LLNLAKAGRWVSDHNDLVRAYSKHFDDVQVFDFHGKGDLVTRVVCDLPKSRVRRSHAEEEKGNKGTGTSVSHSRSSRKYYAHANRIAVAAYKAGLISKDFERLDVTN